MLCHLSTTNFIIADIFVHLMKSVANAIVKLDSLHGAARLSVDFSFKNNLTMWEIF